MSERIVSKKSKPQQLLQTEPEPAAADRDPFSVASIRLSQDFATLFGGKKIITEVPVQKPSAQAFIRVRPGAEWRVDTALLELKEEREQYLVDVDMREELANDIKPATLVTCIDRQGNLFLWAIRLPDISGKDNRFWQTARDIALIAEKQWVRVRANVVAKGYEAFTAGPEAETIEPAWPEDLTFEAILKLAFRNYLITSAEHPVVKRLRWS